MPDNLHQRGEIWHYRKMIGGRLYRGSTKETSLKAAKEFLRILTNGLKDRTIHPDMRKSPTLTEFAVRFLSHIDKRHESKDLDRDTQRTYHNGWRLLSTTPVAHMRLDQIGRPDAAELEFPGSPSNANQALRTLSRMLNYAAEVGYLRAAPKIPLRKENERIVVIEPWLEDLLLEKAPNPLHAVMTIMLDCGMRPDEVCRMRWEHVYFGDRQIYIPYGKTRNAKRYVGLTERMCDELKSLRGQAEDSVSFPVESARAVAAALSPRNSPWVFPATVRRKLRPDRPMVNPKSAWQRLMRTVAAEIAKRGLPALPDGLVLYSCRHTFATNFLRESNGDVGRLMALMGHSDMKTTMKYLHPSTAGAAKVMDRHNQRRLEIVRKKA
jgi:integrase